MALVKVYRVAYLFGEEDSAEIRFSKWVQVGGIGDVLSDLPKHLEISKQSLTLSEGGEPVEITPIILGWEEKTLDTEPI